MGFVAYESIAECHQSSSTFSLFSCRYHTTVPNKEVRGFKMIEKREVKGLEHTRGEGCSMGGRQSKRAVWESSKFYYGGEISGSAFLLPAFKHIVYPTLTIN